MTVTPPMHPARIDHRKEVQHHDSEQDQEDLGCALRIGAVGQHDNERRDAVGVTTVGNVMRMAAAIGSGGSGGGGACAGWYCSSITFRPKA